MLVEWLRLSRQIACWAAKSLAKPYRTVAEGSSKGMRRKSLRKLFTKPASIFLSRSLSIDLSVFLSRWFFLILLLYSVLKVLLYYWCCFLVAPSTETTTRKKKE
jgi:hypothetical protein